MPTVVIIPVKSFRLGKLRLAERVSTEARSALGRAFASHAAETVDQAGMMPLVVAGDGEVASWAIGQGFPSLPDPGTGLNGAAAEGMAWAAHTDSPWVILHADLPLLGPRDLVDVREALTVGHPVIAPSADGGTSALGGHETVAPRYGPGSFHRHLALLDDPTIITTTGLLHDVDSADDLRSILNHPRGKWLEEWLG